MANRGGRFIPKVAGKSEVKIPPVHDWRTTDEDEINRRRLRARSESFLIKNSDPQHPIFSNFKIKSGSGMTYAVEIRDLQDRQFSCDCVDFRINGLGTCKHVEAILVVLEKRFSKLYKQGLAKGSDRIEIVVDYAEQTLRALKGSSTLPKSIAQWFDARGLLQDRTPEAAAEALKVVNRVRLSQDIEPWLQTRRQAEESRHLRREYEIKVQSGEWPAHETLVPLFPYQREGMLHLAFTERALLADEMGLGKTIQAIAACALLHRLGKAKHVLVVTPASLKTEWEEQIQRFTTLPYQLIFGQRQARLAAYSSAPFFTIVNYEQMVRDSLDVNLRLEPDVVVLDEAQRIKNWGTKTTQSIKRLQSRYAFVLTGTPIENRIDELYSLMGFLNPGVLGPLFRFNREYYDLDDRGRPASYKNLEQLHARIKPYMLRRRKSDVETELPERTDRTHFVAMSSEQKNCYADHEAQVVRLGHAARRRPLTQQEQDKLMRELAMMRMTCDTNYILNPKDRACPKLKEMEKILEECRENSGVKVIIFSEWERMLELVRELCRDLSVGYAWHTGSVPQRKRRSEINTFKSDPNCRVFLSTDSGSTGLNLQNASVVVNCDLPWNPAKLEQRIARAWRKHQTRPVTVINLVSENTIEHRMLETIANKRALSDGVLDLQGDLGAIPLRTGRQALLARLEQLVRPNTETPKPETASQPEPLPVDRPLGFARRAVEQLGTALVRCEERYPQEGQSSVLLVVVERDALAWKQRLAALHLELFGPGKSDPLSPTVLEVIDRTTDEAMKRLLESGLAISTVRGSRILHPEIPPEQKTLSPEDQARLKSFRLQGERKLKMSMLLSSGDFLEEAQNALSQAILSFSKAFAVQDGLPEPEDLRSIAEGPVSVCWKDQFSMIQAFIESPEKSLLPMIEALQKSPWLQK